MSRPPGPLEDRLRQSFAREADRPHPPRSDLDDVLERVRRLGSRRRRVQGLTVGVAAIVVLAVAVAAFVVRDDGATVISSPSTKEPPATEPRPRGVAPPCEQLGEATTKDKKRPREPRAALEAARQITDSSLSWENAECVSFVAGGMTQDAPWVLSVFVLSDRAVPGRYCLGLWAGAVDDGSAVQCVPDERLAELEAAVDLEVFRKDSAGGARFVIGTAPDVVETIRLEPEAGTRFNVEANDAGLGLPVRFIAGPLPFNERVARVVALGDKNREVGRTTQVVETSFGEEYQAAIGPDNAVIWTVDKEFAQVIVDGMR